MCSYTCIFSTEVWSQGSELLVVYIVMLYNASDSMWICSAAESIGTVQNISSAIIMHLETVDIIQRILSGIKKKLISICSVSIFAAMHLLITDHFGIIHTNIKGHIPECLFDTTFIYMPWTISSQSFRNRATFIIMKRHKMHVNASYCYRISPTNDVFAILVIIILQHYTGCIYLNSCFNHFGKLYCLWCTWTDVTFI